MTTSNYAAKLAAMDQDIAAGNATAEEVMAFVRTLAAYEPKLSRIQFLSGLAVYATSLYEQLDRRDHILLMIMLLDRLLAADQVEQS